MVLSCLPQNQVPFWGLCGVHMALSWQRGSQDELSFLSTVFWGVVAAVPTAGDPKRCPSMVRGAWCVWSPFQKPPCNRGSAPCPRVPLGEEKGEAAGSWWVVVCFN